MVRPLRDDERAYNLWSGAKVKCPICNKSFNSWYCPNCGLPKNNSQYINYEGYIYYCGPNHFRCEFGAVSEYQMCAKCRTPNPYNANYCKNCGENITLHAKDKKGHGWIDLGLSVLWSTETMGVLYLWNHGRESFGLTSNLRKISLNVDNYDNKDVATACWGEKWRTPTKEEFEELSKRCKWEKCIDSITNKHALKVIGPNGNSIIIPVTGIVGHVGLSNDFTCRLWTSTEADKHFAYCFDFRGYHNSDDCKCPLTAKEKKRQEFAKSNNARFNVDLSIDNWLYHSFEQRSKMIEEKRRKIFPQYEKTLEQQRKILDAMGDDSQEKAANNRIYQERKQKLWLDTTKSDLEFRILRVCPKWTPLAILPVADKKWQGKL